MQLLDLNVDVLLHIANFLPRKDLSRLTRTCHALHDILSPAILSGIVWLTRCSLASFCKFMHVDSGGGGPDRDLFPFLRILRFNLLPDFRHPMSLAESVHTFTNLLRHSRHLVSLSLFCVSMAFTPEQLKLALSTPFPELQDVILDGVTADYKDVLAGVTSPLRYVNLTMSKYADGGINDELANVDPLPFLRYHRSTITTLTLSQVALGDLGLPLSAVRRLMVFSFSLENDETGWAGPLVHLFPSVEHVELWSLHTRDGSAPTRNLDPRDPNAFLIADGWRRRGKAWQAQRVTWAHGLRFLRAHSFMDLYCLGLSCHIARLDVYDPSPLHEINAAVLSDVRPRCLWFPISSSSEMDGPVPALLRAVARTPSVTHLMVELGEGLLIYSDPQDLLVRLGELLRNTAVSHLFMHIGDDNFPERAGLFGGVPSVGGSSTPVAGETADTRVPRFLTILGRDNRTLRRVFASFEQPQVVNAWEAHRAGEKSESVQWSEVGQLRARELMNEEGLVRYED